MKTKKITQKLSLKKSTVANLSYEKMSEARGGAPTTSYDVLNHCWTECKTGYCCFVIVTDDCPDTTIGD